MTSPTPALQDFSDRLSPMMVKELRHGLRTRVFTTALMSFHAILIMLMPAAMVSASQEGLDMIFWTVACLVLLGMMPLRGFAAVTGEVREGTLDMLYLTGISAFRIVAGKWAALFSQGLLVASSLLPYIVARYYFGGVEIVRETLGLAMAVLGSGLATAMLVAFSTQKQALLRLVLAAGTLAGALFWGVGVCWVAAGPGGEEILEELGTLPLWEAAGAVAGVVLAAGYLVYFFLAFGASRIASVAENHSTRKRLVAFGFMGTAVAAGLLMVFFHVAEEAAVLLAAALVAAGLLGMDMTTEAMPTVPTALPDCRRWPAPLRACRWLLYPGWASGVLCYLAMWVLPLVLTLAIDWNARNPAGEELYLGLAGFLTCVLVPVCLPLTRKDRFLNWVLTLLTLCIGGSLLLITVEVIDVEELRIIGVVTPVTALLCTMDTYHLQEFLMIGGAISGGLWTAGAVVLAVREGRTYGRLEAEMVLMQAGSPAPAAAAEAKTSPEL